MTYTDITERLDFLEKQAQAVIKNAKRIVDTLQNDHALEPDSISTSSNPSVKFLWHPQEFNIGHVAAIAVWFDGSISATTYSLNCTPAAKSTAKFWWVDHGPEGELVLSLPETIEYIRHHIWANHNL